MTDEVVMESCCLNLNGDVGIRKVDELFKAGWRLKGRKLRGKTGS
jgi:hypothetical protein